MGMDRLQLYRWMALSREFDRALCAANPRWFPAEGEEAVVVGAFCDLRPTDAAAVHYRDPFAAYAMRGAELWRLASQVFGKAAGYSKGRAVPFTGPVELGIVPWVAGDLGTSLGTAVTERALRDLVAPVVGVGARPAPIPSGPLRRHALTNAPELVAGARRVVSGTVGC